MASFKNEQRRITYRDRVFHFVSYEAHAANPTRKQVAMPDTWYLVSSGNRWPAIATMPEQTDAELDALLLEWLEEHVFADVAPAEQAAEA